MKREATRELKISPVVPIPASPSPSANDAAIRARRSVTVTTTATVQRIPVEPSPKVQQTLSTATTDGRRFPRLRANCRRLSESWKFAVLTTALTVYALFGDDLRVAVIHKDADIAFDVLTIISVSIFTLEVACSSIGLDEYFLGFFFFLDAGSTATLILDLTWIGNAIFCSEGEGQGALRTGRAGRAGARASRTVRIIRLMRLAKLYKAYKTNLENKKAKSRANRPTVSDMDVRESRASIGPGEGEDDQLSQEDVPEEGAESPGTRAIRESVVGIEPVAEPEAVKGEAEAPETRVGKKLSDMTTRRVIILVLVMLFVMPLFSPSSHGLEEFYLSSQIGADMVYDRWRTYCAANTSAAASALPWCLDDALGPAAGATLQRHELARSWFEMALLNYVYQHHTGDFAWKLFWMGATSASLAERLASDDQAKRQVGNLLRLNQAQYLGSFVYPMDTIGARFSDSSWDIHVVPIQEAVKTRLTRAWQERCGSFTGVPVQPSVEALIGGCSANEVLRCAEREYAAPLALSADEESDFSMLFTFDIRGTTKLEAGLSMLQTIFICFAVGLGALSFTKDANELLLNPIERMIAKMETIKDNPLEAMRLGDLEYRREELETARRKEELAQMGRCLKLIYRSKYLKKQKELMAPSGSIGS